ncbi:MAG: DMT family transporter [Rhodospirillales bacterium]|nr:DMT family transporter [Rhodospirillales bacterium]
MRWLNNGYVLMVVTALAWSGNNVVGRGVVDLVPPIGLSFWRWSLALPVFVILSLPYIRRDLPLAIANWPIVLLLAVISVSIYNTFIYIGLTTTLALNALLIHTGRPIVIVLLSYLFFGRKISLVQGGGLFLGLMGTAAIIMRGEWDLIAGVSLNQGDIWIAVASFLWALYTVLYNKRPKIHPTSMMVISILIGLSLLAPFYIWEATTQMAVPLTGVTFWSVGYLALIATGVAYMTYNRTVEVLGANAAGLTSYLVLLFGAILAIIFLGEELAAYHAVGAVLIIAGTYLATLQKAEA